MHENNSRNIEAVSRFNRFYTRFIGLLDERILASPFSLSEARVIYEVAQYEKTTATRLKSDLGLDAGYLSRMLSSFEKRGFIERKSSAEDARQIDIWLTEIGREAFSTLNSASQEEIANLLDHLYDTEQADLICAMQTIETLLREPPEKGSPYLLRPPRSGDLGWVVHRHGVLYAREYGWDEKFEALVAGIVANFVNQFDSKKERCWIAEKDARNVGSVFLVKKTDEIAKLRLLLVEPEARGFGIGSRLVDECIRFAHQAGYQKITLWTNDVLTAARKIYQKAGFLLVHQEPNLEFGHNVISETWELEL